VQALALPAGAQTGACPAVNVARPDRSGRLLVGTAHCGLFRLDAAGASFESLSGSDASRHPPINDLLEAQDGSLWIATDAGLLHGPLEARGRGAQQPFTRLDGLPEGAAQAIFEDESGAIWVATARGLVRRDAKTGISRVFGRWNSLADDRFQRGAKLASRSGQFLLGAQTGLVAFYPTAFAVPPPETQLAVQLLAEGTTLGHFTSRADASAAVRLESPPARLTARFSAMRFDTADAHRYRYKLEGFEQGWQTPDSLPEASYTRLPPGQYTFRVEAAASGGSWNTSVRLPVLIGGPLLTMPILLGSSSALLGMLLGFAVWRNRAQATELRHARTALTLRDEARSLELAERNRQLEELNQRLREASITDPLTGLLNRRSFYEFVSREVARIERDYTQKDRTASQNTDKAAEPAPQRYLFFMMIDLDEFKPINDTYGHHAGDHTLVQVSQLLRACAREADTVFRWGGDEFLIIGQVASPDDMELLAERFRNSIAEHRFDPMFGKALRLSASIGVAPYPFAAARPGLASWEQVADIADQCAYLAKSHGKDAWVCARGGDELTPAELAEIKDNLEMLIQRRRVLASSSRTAIPIAGARQR
jgi:diguanylate cyclase (GGDEF)-like protein